MKVDDFHEQTVRIKKELVGKIGDLSDFLMAIKKTKTWFKSFFNLSFSMDKLCSTKSVLSLATNNFRISSSLSDSSWIRRRESFSL